MKYTYSEGEDEDDGYSDATTSRRSTRNTGTHTPAEGLAPTVTQSGRQVKARQGGAYGESILSGSNAPAISVGGYDGTSDGFENDAATDDNAGRPRRAAAINSNGRTPKGGRHIEGYNDVDEMTSDEEGDADEQDYGDDEEEDDPVLSDVEDQDDMTDADEDEEMQDTEKKSLVVKLPVKTPTPERKTFLKLRLTPEKSDSSKSPSLVFNINGQVDPSKPQGKENTLPAPVSSEAPDSLKRASTPPAVPIPVPSASRSPLAFRGSPEKPNPFTPSIDVGYGRS